MGNIATVLAGFLFRVFQVIVESSLYLLIGFLVAGGLRALVEPARLRQFFGTGRWTGPVRAWAAATLLPVCSLGVLPVLRELRRARVRRDAVLTFALAAPIFNPVSLLYGASYLGAGLLTTLAVGTLFIAVAAGMLCGPGGSAEDEGLVPCDEDAPLASTGSQRLRAGAVHAARGASGPVLVDIAVGIVVAGLVAAVLDPAWLAEGTFSGDPKAIPLMTAVALPTYVTSEKAVATLPEMLKFRQSSGAMFCLIVLGVGVSAGQLSWIGRSYGPGIALRWVGVIVTLTVAGAYAIDRQIPAVGTSNVDNDHFDVFTNTLDASQLSAIQSKVGNFAANVGTLHWMTLGAVSALILAGVILRTTRFGRLVQVEGPSIGAGEDPPSPRAKSVLDFELPRWLLASFATVGILSVVGVGAFAFFPSPEEIFRDMTIIKADYFGELAAASPAAPLHHLDLWDRQVARLPLGALIRLSRPSDEARQLTGELRTGIRRLRGATESGRRDEARAIFAQLQSTVNRCKQAYQVW
jgi:uncharacterized membrane protein YraQ (UPF0718 family)